MGERIFAMLLGFAAGLILGALASAQDSPSPVVSSQYDAELIALDELAIGEAYKFQITHLFIQWMKDHTGQPERARRGANQARQAYAQIMLVIEQRKRQQQIPMPMPRP